MSDTAHFKESEFACRCGCGKTWPKQKLINLLEQARMIYGKPIIIESGCRCPVYNKKVGGVPDSAHLTGEAADVRCWLGEQRWRLLDIFLSLGFMRIGIGSIFIHVDISETLPQKVIWLYGE